jgi:hypothetical protein
MFLQVLRVRHGGIARQHDHRNMRARRFGQGGDAIGQGRAVGDRGDADPARDAPVGQRHQHRAALEGDRHEGAAPGPHEVIDHEEVGVPHQPEHRVELMIGEGLGDGLVDVHAAGSLAS